MRVLFVLNTPGFLRYFDVTVEALLARGHDVALAFNRPDLRPESLEILDSWPRKPEILDPPPARADELAKVVTAIRAAADYVRYLDPRFEGMEYLRNRRRRRGLEVAPWTRVFGYRESIPAPLARSIVGLLLRLERAVPSAEDVEAYLRAVQPDVLAISPLVTGASPQTDYVKAARTLGIPCAVCVASWDNLTNKGLLRETPDKLVVWNQAQVREAVDLHGLRADGVVVTGAQPFDRWFGRQPQRSREDFCAVAGLDPARPIVLFVGSTSNIAREGVEEVFVRNWLRALRRSDDDAVSGAGILVRPHPDRAGSWTSIDVAGVEGAIVWPPERPNSVTPSARSDYFESLYHADAVVGINTSAMIEAAIIGRPVLTVQLEEFEQAQLGTMHFRHLLPENGGFLAVSKSLEEHVAQLSAQLADPMLGAADRTRFVEHFIRPHGLDRPANDVLVETLEQLATLPARQPETGPLSRILRTIVVATARLDSRRQPDAVRQRLKRRTRRLASVASRAHNASTTVGSLLERLAALHVRYAKLRVNRVTRRQDRRRTGRAQRSRADKRRGVELLTQTERGSRASNARLKMLFVMRHSGYVRNFEWVLSLLAERGHRIHLGFEIERPQAELAERLERDSQGAITHGYVPVRNDQWRPLTLALRQSIDYIRYMRPSYADAPKLRLRATKGTPKLVIRLTNPRVMRSRPALALVDRALRFLERHIPDSPAIDRYVADGDFDIVAATPFVAGHSQTDYIRAGKRHGRATALPVNSWDNLTNKGLIRDPQPDRIYVWNEVQRREAIEFHGVAPANVVAVGAHTFDHWFDWQVSTSRAEFCDRVGLDPARPYLLYLCSSGFIAADERPVVTRWVQQLRSHPELRDVGILVRPHPSPGRAWAENPLAGLENVVVYPPIGADPRDLAPRNDYYDSISHSLATVGVNTTALIEAAIVGRRTFTVLLPEFRDTQEGTLHFHYLMSENGGPLTVAQTMDEHLGHLRDALVIPADDAWNRPFLESFVRPHGIDVRSAPIFADDLERFVRTFQSSAAPRRSRLVARVILRPLAVAAARWVGRSTRSRKARSLAAPGPQPSSRATTAGRKARRDEAA